MSDTYPYGFRPQNVFDSGEVLTGLVMGKKASDIEERWYRASEGTNWRAAAFRVRIDPTVSYIENVWTNVPGELEIDYLMTNGVVTQPVSIKGQISHFYTDWQKQVDQLKEARINEFARGYGWLPIISVPSRREDLYKLSTQSLANQTFREVLP